MSSTNALSLPKLFDAKRNTHEPSMPTSSSRDFAEDLLLLQLESLPICIVGVEGPY